MVTGNPGLAWIRSRVTSSGRPPRVRGGGRGLGSRPWGAPRPGAPAARSPGAPEPERAAMPRNPG